MQRGDLLVSKAVSRKGNKKQVKDIGKEKIKSKEREIKCVLNGNR